MKEKLLNIDKKQLAGLLIISLFILIIVLYKSKEFIL